MIATLRGTLLHASPTRLIVECCGVGYDVAFAASGLKRLPDLGHEIFVHIFTKVREDAIELFGFIDVVEKEMFAVLIGVSGVGPKGAMNILAVATPGELARAVMTDDLRSLTALPGVGKKTAERLCLELKDKVQPFADLAAHPQAAPAVQEEVDQVGADVVSALSNLGYPPAQARDALSRVRQALPPNLPPPPIEELLRLTLRSLA
jgi:Holliday junction DNA helicase RuvA